MERSRIIISIHCFLLFLICTFIFSIHVPVLVDYPNHLARVYLSHNLDHLPIVQQFYYRKFEFVPYLGMDLFFDLAQNFFNIYLTGQIFICLSIILLTVAFIYLSKTIHGRIENSTFLIYLVIFNTCLYWGFVNYYLVISFALFAFALWLKLENKRSKLVIFLLLSQLIFILHILAFIALLIVTGIYELQKNNFAILRNIKKLILLGLYFGCTLILPIVISINTNNSLDLGTPKFTEWGSYVNWIYGIISPFNFVNPALAIFIELLLIGAYLTKTIIITKNSWLILILFAICLAIPHRLNGIFNTQLRLPIVAILILFAMSRLSSEKTGKTIIFKSLLSVLAAVNIWLSCLSLYQSDKLAESYIKSIQTLETGARIFTILPANNVAPTGLRFNHIDSLAVIEAQAYVPSLINAIPPIRTQNKFLPTSTLAGRITSDVDFIIGETDPAKLQKQLGKLFFWRNWQSDFDYIDYFHYGTPRDLGKTVADQEIIYKDNFHTIYKVKHEAKP